MAKFHKHELNRISFDKAINFKLFQISRWHFQILPKSKIVTWKKKVKIKFILIFLLKLAFHITYKVENWIFLLSNFNENRTYKFKNKNKFCTHLWMDAPLSWNRLPYKDFLGEFRAPLIPIKAFFLNSKTWKHKMDNCVFMCLCCLGIGVCLWASREIWYD